MRGSDTDKTKVVWKGRGDALSDAPSGGLPIPAGGFPVVVQVSISDTQVCFETIFDEADVVSNLVDKLKLKSN